MKSLRATVLALLCVPSVAPADTAFDGDLPREVVEQLLGGLEPPPQLKLYSDIFTAFPPFTLPAGFEVLASADEGVFRHVLLKTGLDDEAALAAMTAALHAEGWMDMPAGSTAQHTGFIGPRTPVQNLSFCSDQLGRMGLSITANGSRRYAHLSHIVRAPSGGFRRSCEYEARRLRGPTGPE